MRLLPKPVGKTAKTSFFSRRASTACSCSFFSLIPPNFTSHTGCMISAILYSFVYYNFTRQSSSKATSMTDTCHQSEGNQSKYSVTRVPGVQNRCMKPVQSLFSLVFRRPRYSRLAASPLAARMSRMPSRSFSLRIFEQKRDCSQSTSEDVQIRSSVVSISRQKRFAPLMQFWLENALTHCALEIGSTRRSSTRCKSSHSRTYMVLLST